MAEENEILISLATDNKVHWFKKANDTKYKTKANDTKYKTKANDTKYKTKCGKEVEPTSSCKQTDFVCKDCYKAIIEWADGKDDDSFLN
jgi:hypothetical protein